MKRLDSILPKWSSLGSLASAKLISSMYVWLIIVPLLAKLLSGIGDKVRLRIFDHEFTLNLSLPFSWELFYLSAVLFTLADLVFFFRAPRIVKDHVSAKGFRDAGKGWNQLRSYREDSEMTEARFTEIRAFLMGEKTDPDRRYHSMTVPENRYHELFWSVYEHANTERISSRTVCAALFVAGLASIAVVFCQNLLVVVELAFPCPLGAAP